MGKRRCAEGFGAVGWGDSLRNPAFTQMDSGDDRTYTPTPSDTPVPVLRCLPLILYE
jgi:hypothetical protein